MTSAPTDIFEFCTCLAPGRELDYERFHRAIPADLDRAMRNAGVLNWRIYRDGTTLTHVVEARDRRRMEALLDADPTNRAWQTQVTPYLAREPAESVLSTGGTLIWDFSWPTR